MLKLDHGLYVLRIGEIGGRAGEVSGMALPAVQLSAPPSNGVEILAGLGDTGSWIGQSGGAVVLKSPTGGGHILITTFVLPDHADVPLAIEINRLDRSPPDLTEADMPTINAPLVADADMPASPREIRTRETRTGEIPTEIMLHVERAGDRSFPGRGWVGNRGQKLRIEAFSIRPLEQLSPNDIEFKGFGPNGRETPWISDGKLCGTRGRRLPLTGFAIRLAPPLRDQFEVVYQGSFFSSGLAGPSRNGEPCIPSIPDDPLEAMNVRLVQRRAG